MNRMPAALTCVHARTRRRVFTLAFAGAVAGGLALAAGASADLLTPESGGSANADDIDTLYKIVLVVATVIFIGVEGALVYSLVKFRARKNAVAAQIRGNTRLEIGWTIGAAVVLVVLAVVTFAMLGGIRTPPNSDADGFATPVVQNVSSASAFQPRPPNGRSLNIKVNGQRYVWRYTYPDDDDNVLNNTFSYVEMVVPTKTTITLNIDAQDVAHSWWIPALGGKFDGVPGHTNFTWLRSTSRASTADSAPSCAGATTLTWSRRCARSSRPSSRPGWRPRSARSTRTTPAPWNVARPTPRRPRPPPKRLPRRS